MSSPPFDPAKHLSRVNGGEYLAVRHRIAWLRDDAPDSQIITELLETTAEFALFKATVTRIIDGEVRGVATGYGSETSEDFRDHIEKAESKAVGRALKHLGYDAQSIEGEAPPQGRQDRRPAPPRRADDGAPAPVDNLVTPRQLAYLKVVAREAGLDADVEARRDYGVAAGELSRRDASALIQRIQDAVPSGDPYP